MIEIMMNLQGGAKAPLYEKIYEYIKSEITDGRIPRGERLPSTRLLAKNLAVSRSTVEMAYDQLLAEGYIQAEPCRGFLYATSRSCTGFRETALEKRDGYTERKNRSVWLIFPRMRSIPAVFRTTSGGRSAGMCCWTTVRNC